MNRAVIVLGGTISDYEFTNGIFSEDDFVICADGGLKHLDRMDITPDVWIGDNDSCNMSDVTIAELSEKCEIIKLNSIKDATDGEEACSYACKKGFDKVVILGFFGNRMDHVFGNVFLLKKLSDAGIKAVAINEYNMVYFAEKHNELSLNDYSYVSVIPLSSVIENVSNIGLYYKLKNEALFRYSTRGISNVPVNDVFAVDIGSGDALIILSKD